MSTEKAISMMNLYLQSMNNNQLGTENNLPPNHHTYYSIHTVLDAACIENGGCKFAKTYLHINRTGYLCINRTCYLWHIWQV